MSKFKVGDKVVATSQAGSKLWVGLEVVGLYLESCGGGYKCEIKSKASEWFGQIGAFAEDDLTLVQPKPRRKRRDYVADHARRTLRKAGLSKEVAAKWVANAQRLPVFTSREDFPRNADGRADLGKFSRSIPHGLSLSSVVTGGFRWADATEGEMYWSKVEDDTHA